MYVFTDLTMDSIGPSFVIVGAEDMDNLSSVQFEHMFIPDLKQAVVWLRSTIRKMDDEMMKAEWLWLEKRACSTIGVDFTIPSTLPCFFKGHWPLNEAEFQCMRWGTNRMIQVLQHDLKLVTSILRRKILEQYNPTL